MRNRKGVTLIEVLISMVLIALASIATLNYFAYAKGNVAKTGNRRAALERARERLEQLMAANISSLPQSDPSLPQNGQPVIQLACSGTPCTWNATATPEPVQVDDVSSQMVSTIQWKDDPSAGTTTPDVVEFAVRVGFVPGWDPTDPATDDDFHRVLTKTLRTL